MARSCCRTPTGRRRISARTAWARRTVFKDDANYLRLRKVSFVPAEADAMRLVVTETWGDEKAHVFALDARFLLTQIHLLCFLDNEMKQLPENDSLRMISAWLERNSYAVGVNDSDGWFYNRFFSARIPYLWRSNARCSRARFAVCLKHVFDRLRLNANALVFHENFGAWKDGIAMLDSRFLLLDTLEELIWLVERHMWNIGKETSECLSSDNYNVIFLGHDVCLVFSHENETCIFSREKAFLQTCATYFRLFRFTLHEGDYAV